MRRRDRPDHQPGPRTPTLIRLVISEAPHFPAILDLWRNRGIVPIIAEPLAKLAASGLPRRR